MNLKKLYIDIKKSKSIKEALKNMVLEINKMLNKKIYIKESDLLDICLSLENNFGLTDLFLEELKNILINKTAFKIKNKYISYSRLNLILGKVEIKENYFNKKNLIEDNKNNITFELNNVFFKIIDLFEESDFFNNDLLLTKERIKEITELGTKGVVTEKHLEYIFKNLLNVKSILFFDDYFIRNKTFEKIKELKDDFDSLPDEEKNKILSIFIKEKI